jgi:hypothetical protein
MARAYGILKFELSALAAMKSQRDEYSFCTFMLEQRFETESDRVFRKAFVPRLSL